MNFDFSEARGLKRFPFLDAARGVASMIVVAAHCDLNWFWGVMDFFFVMSGLLITRSLISNCNKGRGTASFLLYRALRLLPAYLSVLLVYEIAVRFTDSRGSFDTLPYLLFYQNTDLIFGSVEKFPRIMEITPFWSLVLEEQFYMVWGFFFCVVAYAKLHINLKSLGIAALMIACGMLFRILGVHWWTLPGRFDGFLMGCVMSVIIFTPNKVRLPEKSVPWLLGLGGILSLAALARLIWSGIIYHTNNELYLKGIWLDITCFSIVSVVLILIMLKIDIRRIHFGRLQNGLAFLGLISYETYLIHFPIIVILKKILGYNTNQGGRLLFAIAMVVSTIVAYGMHRALTAPALKHRERVHDVLAGWWAATSQAFAPLRLQRQRSDDPPRD